MFRLTARALHLPPLSAPTVTRLLQEQLPGWKINGNHPNTIERDLAFPDFTTAIKYMQAVAPECDRLEHHPMWINVYNTLFIRLTTHDAGNMVTQKDIDLAKFMNQKFDEMMKK